MINIAAKGVQSLCFVGDELVDWVAGGRVFQLDGTERPRSVIYAYRFDAATSSADGRYAVIYERLGTKALVLDRGNVVRELNRSFYHAGAYEYPVHLFRLPDDRTIIAHCPERYGRIEFEEVTTGRRLTESSARKPRDFFHSRLASNPSGTRLLSAGWAWHPWDAVIYFDVERALQDATHLDGLMTSESGLHVGLAEESSACWLSDDQVAVASSTEEADDPEAIAELGDKVWLPACSIGVFDVPSRRYLRSHKLSAPAGTIMRLDETHVISFYEYPKLISLTTGEVVTEWRQLKTGVQTSSICLGLDEPVPPIAFDPDRRRFAVADGERIHVVTVDPST